MTIQTTIDSKGQNMNQENKQSADCLQIQSWIRKSNYENIHYTKDPLPNVFERFIISLTIH